MAQATGELFEGENIGAVSGTGTELYKAQKELENWKPKRVYHIQTVKGH